MDKNKITDLYNLIKKYLDAFTKLCNLKINLQEKSL